MDIRIIPVKIDNDGLLSFYVTPGKDPAEVEFINLGAVKKAPGEADILKGLTGSETPGEDPQTRIMVKPVPHTSDTEVFYAVIGNDKAFEQLFQKEKGRWVTQMDMKFGPLPDGEEKAGDFNELYVETLSIPHRAGLIGAAHITRVERVGPAFSGNASIEAIHHMLAPGFDLIAEDSTQVARFMNTLVDSSLPALYASTELDPVASKIFRGYSVQIGRLAAEAMKTIKARAKPADPEGARKRAGTRAAKDRGKGDRPKPA